MASISASTLQDQAAALTALARELQTKISSATPQDTLDHDILSCIGEQLEQILLIRRLPSPARSQVDEAGTALWNICSNAMGTFAGNEENMIILSRVRALAFGLVEITASSGTSDHTRALKVAIAAARSCIYTGQLQIGLKILGAGARRLESLKSSSQPISQMELSSITVEYYSLRVRIAWLQGRWDIAEHLFFKMPLTSSITNREIIVEVAYSVGCDAFVGSQPGIAVQWLERAVEQMQTIAAHQSQASCPENLDLHVRHALVRAYLHAGNFDAGGKLKEQMKVLKENYGAFSAILFLELEAIRQNPKSKIDVFFEVLKKIIYCLEFTEESLQLVNSYIKVSKRLSLGHALGAHQSLLLHLPIDRQDWIQRSFIRFLFMVTSIAKNSQLPGQLCIDFIREAAEAMKEREIEALSSEVAHAALILIWGQVEGAMKNHQFYIADKWCHLVLDIDIFKNISGLNKRKIQRKRFAIAMKYCDTDLARQALSNLIIQSGDKPDPKALFLCYKLGLLEGNDIFGELVYFVLNTKETDHLVEHRDVVECLQNLIDQTQAETDLDEKPTVAEKYLFPLFVLAVELRKPKFDERQFEMMMQLFRLVSSETQLSQKDNEAAPSHTELQWICSKCYQLARVLLKHSRTKQLGQFIDVMQELVSAFSKSQGATPVIVRELSCLVPFLGLTLHAIYTRTLTDPQDKQKHYKEMFECIKTIKKIQTTHPDWYELTIHQVIAGFELEVAIVRKDWGSFKCVIECMKHWISLRQTAWVMDTLLSFDLPIKHRVFGVRFIIGTIFERGYLHPERRESLPRYLHVLFDLCISAAKPCQPIAPPDPSLQDPPEAYLKIAESVIDQALMSAADEAHLDSEDHRMQHVPLGVTVDAYTRVNCQRYPYPSAELAHLATVSFNQAMDLYKDAKDKDCQRWAKKAIRLAESMNDDEGKRLAALFRGRLNGLFRGSR